MGEATEQPPRLPVSRAVVRAAKRIAIFLALIFFSVLSFVLWALATGRATEFIRQEFFTEFERACRVRAEISQFALSPFPPELHMTELKVRNRDGVRFAAVEQAIVSLRVFPLFYGRIQLDKVALLRPEGDLVVEDGRIKNLPICLEPAEEPKETKGLPIVLGVDELRIEDGRFRLQIPGQLDGELKHIGLHLEAKSSGGADLSFGIDDGLIKVGEREIPLDRFRLIAHLAGPLTQPRAIAVQQLEVGVKDISALGEGSVDLLGPVYEAKIKLAAPLAQVRRFVDGLPEMSGNAEIEASVSGSTTDPRAVGRLSVKNGAIDVYRMGRKVELGFRADKKGIDLDRLFVQLESGKVDAKGRIELDEQLSMKIDAACDAVSLGWVLDNVGVKGPWVDFHGTGNISSKGTLKGPFAIGGAIELLVSDLDVFDRAFNDPKLRSKEGVLRADRHMLGVSEIRLGGKWSADADGISLNDMDLWSGASRGIAQARLGFANKDGLDIDAQFSHFDFLDLGPIAGVGFAGHGELSARIRGPYYDIGGEGTFDLEEANVAGTPFGNMQSNVSWHDDVVLDFESLEGNVGRTSYDADVRVVLKDGVHLDVGGSILSGRVEDLLFVFGIPSEEYGDPKGEIVHGAFDVQGPLKRMTGPLTLSLGGAEILGEKLERGQLVGRLEKGALVADSIDLEKYGARLTGSGSYDFASGALSLSARSNGLTLQKIDLLREATRDLDGPLMVSLETSGNVRGLSGSIVAELGESRVDYLSLKPGRLEGQIKGALVEVSGGLLGGALGIKGTIDLARKLPYRAELTLSEYDVPQLVAAFLGHREWLGLASGRAELSGKLADWAGAKGVISLDKAVFEAGTTLRLETQSATRLELDRGIVDIPQATLVGPETKMSLSGKVGRRLTDLKLQGRLDLGLAATLFEPVERSGGVLLMNAVVRGSAQRLDLLGTGRIERGILKWRRLPSRLTSFSAKLTFSQSTILIDEGVGRYAEGQVSLNGQVLFDGIRPKQVFLDGTLSRVRPRFSSPKFDLAGTIDGKLSLEGPPDKLWLRGAVEIEQGRYRPKFEFTKLVDDPLSRIAPEVYDPQGEILNYDIAIHLKPPARIKNETANVELTGDLRFSGTNERMGLLGSLALVRGGRVNFFGTYYDIEGGAVEFRDRYRFQPRYELDLRARACNAVIDINLTGDLDSFTTSYQSKPELDETNIVSCLKVGRRTDTPSDTPDQTAQLAQSLGMEALWRLSGVDRQVRRVLPVDQIEVTTEYSPRDRVYEPRLLLAKEVWDGRVRLEASSPLTGSKNQRAAVRWRLAPELSLSLGWQYSEYVPAVGDFGVDLKRRWEW